LIYRDFIYHREYLIKGAEQNSLPIAEAQAGHRGKTPEYADH
jgi:hypothetical protein